MMGQDWNKLLSFVAIFCLSVFSCSIPQICNKETLLEKDVSEARTMLDTTRQTFLLHARNPLMFQQESDTIGSESGRNKYIIAEKDTINLRIEVIITHDSREYKMWIDKGGEIHYDEELLALIEIAGTYQNFTIQKASVANPYPYNSGEHWQFRDQERAVLGYVIGVIGVVILVVIAFGNLIVRNRRKSFKDKKNNF